MSRAYLCVSIPVVSDEERGGVARRPQSFEGVTDGVVRRIHPFFERFGAKPTYLLSPAVLRDAGCLEIFRTLGRSAELGTHLDGSSDDDRRAGERDRLTDVTDLFIRAFGHQPLSFRAEQGLGPDSAAILESLGYAVDASMAPEVASARAAPGRPWVLDPGGSLLELPVTARRRRLRNAWRELRPADTTTQALLRLAEEDIAATRAEAPDRPTFLHALFRNVDVVPWASPDGASEEEARGVLDRLRALLVLARDKGIPVVGLADVPEILRA